MSTATQSVTPNALLAAVKTVLVNGDGTAGPTQINEVYINESYSDYHPRSGEPHEICFGLIVNEEPEMYPGAGRLAANTFLTLEVIIYTRLQIDPANGDGYWSSDLEYGALVLRTRVQDILNQNFLYSVYDVVTHRPTGIPLTIEGLQQLRSPKPQKPDHSTTSESQDYSYGEHRLYWSMKTVVPLTI